VAPIPSELFSAHTLPPWTSIIPLDIYRPSRKFILVAIFVKNLGNLSLANSPASFTKCNSLTNCTRCRSSMVVGYLIGLILIATSSFLGLCFYRSKFVGRLSNVESRFPAITFFLTDYYMSDWLAGKLLTPNQPEMKFRNTLVILRQYSLNKLQNNAVTNVLSSMPCGTSRCRNTTKAISLEHLLQSLRHVRLDQLTLVFQYIA
jgi:hypothetical protein